MQLDIFVLHFLPSAFCDQLFGLEFANFVSTYILSWKKSNSINHDKKNVLHQHSECMSKETLRQILFYLFCAYLKPWLGTFYLQMQYSSRQFSFNSVVEFWSTKPEIVKDYLSYTELKPHWVVDRKILTHIFKIVIALQ